ncbi:hypothetical protein ABZ930_29090 [Streptomyces sp. NPDC046716]|uniref:hypothetical protein n=1 Tax=Streptomyces sp. NPDC046716 TaxID=3157093 RepID=UPI003408A524
MHLASVATIAPLITAGAALIVGGVTRWTQRGVAQDRVQWEAKLEVVKFNINRFETTLQHFMDAADAGNRYMAALDDIDVTDYEQREPYVFAILDPIARARVEAHALPYFPGIDEVKSAIRNLEHLVAIPEGKRELLDIWDPQGIGDAAKLLSLGRTTYMYEVARSSQTKWQRLRSGRNTILVKMPQHEPDTPPGATLRPDCGS